VNRAVILARGLGRRMRQAVPGAPLAPDQDAAADQGIKGMIPIGRPFLDFLLSALADAGFTEICLVIGPEHQSVRDYYGAPGRLHRIAVSFAVQAEPRGTADAVLAAHVLAALRALEGPGLAGFEREALVEHSNIPADRVNQFALLAEGPGGRLVDIVEKPDAATAARFGPAARVSMNAWVFGPDIFEACRRVAPSVRGELELQDAVRYAIKVLGTRFAVVPVRAGVLDLSNRGDIAAVAERLKDTEVRL
jgi:dTDP-glucose pyrophosphorylase